MAKRNYGHVPYEIDGVAVSRADYAAYDLRRRKAAAIAELEEFAAEELGNLAEQESPTNHPADTAEAKE